MDLWYSEPQTKNMKLSVKIKETLHRETTDFQELLVVDTYECGKVLLLDNTFQTTEFDEFVYHEMITHVALNTHPNPKNVLVIGGGDGGTIREIIKHPAVEKATLVEIDGSVVEAAKKYLPTLSCALNDPKVQVLVEDGIKHINESENKYDVIMVDSTDPVGPAVGLFAIDFYRAIHKALKPDGIMVAQTESPFLHKSLISSVYKDISSVYPITKLYHAYIPTYPTGMWTFTMGSKIHDPEAADESKFAGYSTKYYTPKVHKAAFALPPFVSDLLKK